MTDLLFTHIVLAVTSVAWTTFTLIKPAQDRLNFTHVLSGLTLLSGAVVTATTGASIVQSCLMGLIYLSLVTSGAVVAQKRLTRQEG